MKINQIEAEDLLKLRFIFHSKKRPWWWVFTFWKKHWENYGEFEAIAEGDQCYEAAPYELGYLISGAETSLVKTYESKMYKAISKSARKANGQDSCGG